MEGIDVSPESVARLHSALVKVAIIVQSALQQRSEPEEWCCPECGNMFSRTDGTRTLTRHERHYCPLPDAIRKLRNRRDIGEPK